MDTTTGTEIYEAPSSWLVPTEALGWLNTKMADLAKRAAKLGVAAPSFEIIETIPQKDERGRVEVLHRVVVSGEAPKLNGWSFVATIDTLETGSIVKVVPGLELSDAERDHAYAFDGLCDQCRTRRVRKATYLVRHEDGRHAIVGSTCLRDFLGHSSPERIASWASVILDVIAELAERETGHGSGIPTAIETEAYLTFVATAIRLWGWSPASAHGDHVTADRVWDAVVRGFSKDEKADYADLVAAYTDDDRDDAEAAIRWALSGDDSNDYRHNVKIACGESVVSAKTRRIAASAVSSYQREQARLAERRAEAESFCNEHVGTVGKRLDLTLVLVSTREFDSDYGVRTLHVMRDDAGHRLVWWRSGDSLGDAGDVLKGRGTVKRHDERNGKAETVLTRCSFNNETAYPCGTPDDHFYGRCSCETATAAAS